MNSIFFLDEHNKPIEVSVPKLTDEIKNSLVEAYVGRGYKNVSEEDYQKAVAEAETESRLRMVKSRAFQEAKVNKIKALQAEEASRLKVLQEKVAYDAKVNAYYARLLKRNKLVSHGVTVVVANIMTDLPDDFPEVSFDKPVNNGKALLLDLI